MRLETFAKLVAKTVAKVPACDRFGSRVWVAHIYNLGQFDGRGIDRPEFDAMLIDAHRAGSIVLGGLDIPEAHGAALVKSSRVELGTGRAAFHFVYA